jgi:hypothetical protein
MGDRDELMDLNARLARIEGALPQLNAGQETIRAEIKASEARSMAAVEDRHVINRADIHAFRQDLQKSVEYTYNQMKDMSESFMSALKDFKNDVKVDSTRVEKAVANNTRTITNVRLKLAGLSLFSGGVTALGIKLIDHLIK